MSYRCFVEHSINGGVYLIAIRQADDGKTIGMSIELTPEQREIAERFEKGIIDRDFAAAEDGLLLSTSKR